MYYYVEQKIWLINYDNGISHLLTLKGTFKYFGTYKENNSSMYLYFPGLYMGVSHSSKVDIELFRYFESFKMRKISIMGFNPQLKVSQKIGESNIGRVRNKI